MGIELRITPLNAGRTGDITALAFDEAEITIGAYNDDTVKLDRALLQGCHARLSEQWDEEAGHYRLILTNISGASIIMVNNSPLISDEYCLIDDMTEMRMGNYLVRARSSLHEGVQSAADNQLAAAPQAEETHNSAAAEAMSAPLPEAGATQAATAPQTPAYEPQVMQAAATTSPQTITASVDAAPVTTTESASMAAPESSRQQPVQTSVQAPSAASSDRDATTTTVFDDIAGNFAELNLDFDILRLCKIQGRIMHAGEPVADVLVDAGEHGQTRSDAHGLFCISGITEGAYYRLTLQHRDYQFHETADLAGRLDADSTVRVDAIKLIDVGGRIMHRGQPVAGIELDAGPFGQCVSDENGYYLFPRVPETARIQIRTRNSDYEFKSAARAAQAQTTSTAATQPPAAAPAMSADAPVAGQARFAVAG
ncbi:hypothetical protein Q4485_16670 [Granulosicoccaceae sp. 1_MG-2023]|nr:hypothetical protein [Granulosicoccaceae sp. 1_MG-2023]